MHPTRQALTGLAALVALAAPFAVAAAPAGAAAATHTSHEHRVTRTFFDTRPCADDGVGYEITATVNVVEHETENAKGGHFTFTETGSFTARPAEVVRDDDGNPIRNDDDDELAPDLDSDGNVVYLDGAIYTGRYTAWGGGNFNGGGTSNFTFTFSVHGAGSDGSTFRENSVFHVLEREPDITKLIFEHDVCH
jgi:hypothetical protein